MSVLRQITKVIMTKPAASEGHCPPPPSILEDDLNLLQPRGADYAQPITHCPPPGLSDLPMAL